MIYERFLYYMGALQILDIYLLFTEYEQSQSEAVEGQVLV